MNWSAVSAISDLVAAAAVVVSLVYLALQVRQNHRAVTAATELETSRMFSELHSRVAASSELARLWDTGLTRPAELTEDEQRRFIWFVAEYFYLVEAVWQQHASGTVSASSWAQHEAVTVGLLKNRLLQEWWVSGVSPYTPEFRAAVDRAVTRGAEHWDYSPLGNIGRPPDEA